MVFEITRSYHFSASHVIAGHPKCGNMHGHNYNLEVTLHSEDLDDQGMVMDFGELDQCMGALLDIVDHRFLISKNDLLLYQELGSHFEVRGMICLELERTTAECIAKWFFDSLSEDLGSMVQEVKIWETARSSATYKHS